MGATAAIIGGSVIGAGAGLYGASMSADAQESAAGDYAQSAAEVNQLQWDMYNQNRTDMQPWMRQGTTAVNRLGALMSPGGKMPAGLTPEQAARQQELIAQVSAYDAMDPQSRKEAYDVNAPRVRELQQLNEASIAKANWDAEVAAGRDPSQPGSLYQTTFTPEDFLANKDPGYQWRMDQGTNALSAKGAAAGNYGSGNMGTALLGFGQGLASEEYQNAYNRWNTGQTNLYNRLAGISGTGQVQSNNIANMGSNMANTLSNNMLGSAAYQGAGQVGAANAWGNAWNNVGNQAMSGMGMYMNNQNQLALMRQMNEGMYPGAQYNPASGSGSYYAGGGGGYDW